MDKSLDEIVAASRPKGIRRGTARRGGAVRTQILGNAAPSPVARARAAATVAAPVPAKATAAPTPEKIMVSNLPLDVNEAQIEELFQTTVGPLRKVQLHYDAQGRSKGVAYVQFSRRGDGRKAYEQYNNRLIDGS
ncbi:hypothetical protein K488DRAFT_42479 [Vararia minispora EC-137]|uniref:Uncharacterized protein n=1 Tax=Vararia minispora EC-137 TaxID=1314806 RepID=A0ACB8QV79_9AGAM|nr:hypothetical protein K488DRAFT_42479 [Vararia minispora EC-137]